MSLIMRAEKERVKEVREGISKGQRGRVFKVLNYLQVKISSPVNLAIMAKLITTTSEDGEKLLRILYNNSSIYQAFLLPTPSFKLHHTSKAKLFIYLSNHMIGCMSSYSLMTTF